MDDLKTYQRKNMKKKRIRNTDDDIDNESQHLKKRIRKTTATDSTTIWQPLNWRQQIIGIEEMRKDKNAPVDTMGCSMLAQRNVDEKTYRFQCLVALLFSSQTKDHVTAEAIHSLQASKNGLNIKSINKMSISEINKLISKVGFHYRKTKYLKSIIKILIHDYDYDIPKTYDELCKLPGIGPKMSNLIMLTAWNICSGIAVDVHVHRIANRLGWTKKITKQPDDTRKILETWLPFDYWSSINHLLVGFGQTICKARNPSCSSCLIKNICPFGKKKKSLKTKKL